MKLYWIDLETTGLLPNKDEVIEISVAEADFTDPFNAKEIYSSVLHFPADRHNQLDPFILDMHGRNGLLVECAKSSKTIKRVEEELLALIPMVENKEERGTLAGSSIHFDHAFIAVHFPQLNKRLSHRHYDVSSIKLFCQSIGMPKFRKAEAHRAKDDIFESIEHAKECREWLRETFGEVEYLEEDGYENDNRDADEN